MNRKELKNRIIEAGPTDEQKNAIFSLEDEIVIKACPGSGKTWCASLLVAWRVNSWSNTHSGLGLLSFTNVAIKTFEQRFSKLGVLSPLAPPHFIGTIDSFLEQFVIGPFGHLVMSCKSRPRLHTSPSKGDRANKSFVCIHSGKRGKIEAWNIIPILDDGEVRLALQHGKSRTPGPALAQCCHERFHAFARRGWYTHNQRGFWAYRLLSEDKLILQSLANRFRELVIDECQDTSGFQQAIFGLLRKAGTRISFIGDPDQCIFEFNQARAAYLDDLIAKEGLKEYQLTLNRRSISAIVEAVTPFCTLPRMTHLRSAKPKFHGAYVCSYASEEINEIAGRFAQLVKQADLDPQESAVVARGTSLARMLQGGGSVDKLQGAAGLFAQAAHARDVCQSFTEAYECCYRAFKRLPISVNWEEIESDRNGQLYLELRTAIWGFVRTTDGLPPVSVQGNCWVEQLRQSLRDCFENMQVEVPRDLKRYVTLKGLDEQQKKSPLSDQLQLSSGKTRITTVHKVKGETLHALMLVAEPKFIKSAMKYRGVKPSREDTRIAYVAMTRPRDLLVIALPITIYRNSVVEWRRLGFEELQLPILDLQA